MSSAVFTYGSLMFPAVWDRVVSGRYLSSAATARGFQRYVVREETYPGVIGRDGESVSGIVYFDVDAADLAFLDAFEGEDYRREDIGIVLADGREIAAATYIYLPVDRLLGEVWDPERFQLDRFLRTYCHARLPG